MARSGLAEATRNLLGVKRVATIACTDAYCTAGMAAFEAAASAQGITVLESVRFENGQSNFGEPLAALQCISRATVFVAIVHCTGRSSPFGASPWTFGSSALKYTWVGDIRSMFEGWARVLP